MASRDRIGFAGIGNMGAPMVRCLAKAGLAVTGFDVRREALAPFATATPEISVAANLAELGAASDIAITMLRDSQAVRAAVLGASGAPGLIDGLKSGALIIDMSSSYPLDTIELAKRLAERGLGLVDAPVSGGVPKAITGTLAIMAGGDAQLIDRAEPVLKAMGTIHRTGRLGSGHAMKVLNNYVSAAGLIATCEALVIGQKFGLDGATMTRVLNASTGRNNTTENKAERYILRREFNSGFALALMEKDVGLARTLAEELGVAATELEFVARLLGRATVALPPGADHTAIYAFLETCRPTGGPRKN
jgi:3-hydroxyisobutyrate dehydrogenase